jgi:hypothetical protein
MSHDYRWTLLADLKIVGNIERGGTSQALADEAGFSVRHDLFVFPNRLIHAYPLGEILGLNTWLGVRCNIRIGLHKSAFFRRDSLKTL